MITYLYRCPECKNEKEIQHSIKDNPRIICEKCNGVMARVPLGGSGFLMNKLGDYTRYRKEGTERAGERQKWIKKHPYDTVPDSLK